MNIHKSSIGLIAIVISVLLVSCVNTRQAIYFNGLKDGTIAAKAQPPESVIQKNDLLNISVSSLNPEASAVFNTPNVYTYNMNGANANMIQGYLVNSEGVIQFPILGNLKAAGQTKEQLKEMITKKLVDQKLLTDPIVTVRFLNFRVTVLGEVNHPGVLSVPNEKISLLEALGLAGDLTIYAKRDNVLVIREDDNGDKEIKRVDLNTTELLSSPYYYLRSNDIVYVEPNKSKVASAGRGQQWIPAVLSGLSLVAIVVDRMVR
ncbi:MAG: polysaccharide biosynthesis/export family protein [Bacteroidetes bacterium]|nr:polysaccharide biosynthesis/export family protein [Bacteroidota bacterium]MBS1632946.1 polysaccharide biosynthesis/export family protein [Bacteroidota bacterium]